jgi:helix-turn-helix protein
MTPKSPPLLTTVQAAARLRTSEQQVRKYHREGALPGFRLAGMRVLRFEASAVEAMLVDAKSPAG